MQTIYYSISFLMCVVYYSILFWNFFDICNFDSMSNFCFLFSFRPIESPWKAKTGLIWGIKGTFIINSVKSEDFCCKSSCNLTTFYMEFLLWYSQFNSQQSQKTWTYLLQFTVLNMYMYIANLMLSEINFEWNFASLLMWIICLCTTCINGYRY